MGLSRSSWDDVMKGPTVTEVENLLPADHAYHKRHMQWTQNGSLDRQMMVFIAQQIVFGYRYYANQYSKLLCMSSADPWSLLYKT